MQESKKRKRAEDVKLMFEKPTSDLVLGLIEFIKYMKETSAKLERKGTLEIEAKVGVLVDKFTKQRFVFDSKSECFLDPALQGYKFQSNMSMAQHQRFNQMLNKAVEVKHAVYKRSVQVDETHFVNGKRFRVTRDGDKIVSVIEKLRIGDLNVYNPNYKFDYRISVNLEVPTTLPPGYNGKPQGTRHKNRLSYTMFPCQIDLTQVKSDETMHELEVEFMGNVDEPDVEEVDAFLSSVQALVRQHH
ncbi:CYTH-like domain-containing protein [Gorgonomyces haynaldii]|nr:CYTH-like domain-containing protein [Gorgonomyces haynaldii]